MVNRPRLQNSINYGFVAALVLAWLPPDPTGVTFVLAFPVGAVGFTAVFYWTGWFVASDDAQ